jgi:hypothetical protein
MVTSTRSVLACERALRLVFPYGTGVADKRADASPNAFIRSFAREKSALTSLSGFCPKNAMKPLTVLSIASTRADFADEAHSGIVKS